MLNNLIKILLEIPSIHDQDRDLIRVIFLSFSDEVGYNGEKFKQSVVIDIETVDPRDIPSAVSRIQTLFEFGNVCREDDFTNVQIRGFEEGSEFYNIETKRQFRKVLKELFEGTVR